VTMTPLQSRPDAVNWAPDTRQTVLTRSQ
jgi:hypothetical protein